MLLSPSFSAEDEEDDTRQLYEVGKTPVVGSLVWLWLPTSFKKSFKGRLPDEHYEDLIKEMKINPRHASRQQVNAFFAHLEKHGGLAERLAGSGAQAWLVRGDRDDWTNAFGTSKKGATEIAEYLTRLFADEHFSSGKPVGPPQAAMRFVADDVCVVKTYVEREGQETSAGEQLSVRRNHSLKVFRREPGGWKIVSDMYMDAREDETFAGGG